MCARGFGCRCGMCDVGYYDLWGKCHECGSQALVSFLSRTVPALGILAVTALFFWAGGLAFQFLLRRNAAVACSVF